MRVGAKLWQACSLTGDIDEKAEVTVKDRKSLTFVAAPSADDSSDNDQDSRLGTSVNRTSRGTGTGGDCLERTGIHRQANTNTSQVSKQELNI